MNRKMMVAALVIGFLAGTVSAQEVVWRRDWKQLPTQTTVTSNNLDGAASGPVDIGGQDFNMVSGEIRTFDDGVGGFTLMPVQTSGKFGTYESIIHMTDVQYAPNTEYTMNFVIGTLAPSSSGSWFLEFGTMVGTNFTILPAVDRGSASFSVTETMPGLRVNDNFSDLFGYNVGGQIIELTADPASDSLGKNVAIRFGTTLPLLQYTGFSDMALTTTNALSLPKKVELIILQ